MGNIKKKVSEKALIDMLVQFYQQQNMQIFREVPFLNRNIDIILTNEFLKETLAIEAKVSWWKKVIDQAKITLLGVDKAYIAMPALKMKSLYKYRNILDQLGIGVISIECSNNNPQIEEILPAIKSRYKIESREKELKKTIYDGFYLSSERMEIISSHDK